MGVPWGAWLVQDRRSHRAKGGQVPPVKGGLVHLFRGQQRTCNARGEEAGAAAGDHGPHHHLGQVGTPGGCHGPEASQVDADGADVAEATQGVRRDDLRAFRNCSLLDQL